MNETLEIGLVALILLLFLALVIFVSQRRIATLRINLEKERVKGKEQAIELGNRLFSEWSQSTIDGMKNQITESVRKEFEALFETWKTQEEDRIRKDAIQKSINTLLGKIGEEFSPVLLSNRYGINLKDFRHLGSPIDFIAFKGLSEESDDVEVIFLEIKSGKTSSLAGRERKVSEAVSQKRVRYEVVNINDLIGNIKNNL